VQIVFPLRVFFAEQQPTVQTDRPLATKGGFEGARRKQKLNPPNGYL
jgi:hypothetical protein